MITATMTVLMITATMTMLMTTATMTMLMTTATMTMTTDADYPRKDNDDTTTIPMQ